MSKRILNAIHVCLFVCVFTCMSSLVICQTPNFEWAKSMGSPLLPNYGVDEYGRSITTDLSGNVYITGSFYGTVDFDPGPGTFNLTSNGEYDIFIQKLNSNGNLIWAKSIGGANPLSSQESGASIMTDPTGNVYIAGAFFGIVDFDPGIGVYNLASSSPTPSYSHGLFLLKLNTNGNFSYCNILSDGLARNFKS